MNDEIATVLDDLRKALAKSETRLAKSRVGNSVDAMHARALLEHAHTSLEGTLEQIEKSHHAVTRSLGLLEEMEKRQATGLQPSTPIGRLIPKAQGT